MPPEIGQAAPDFSLFDSEKNELTLSEQKEKKVLLLFFPLAFTSTCTKELCSIRDNISFYNEVDATVWGISVDSLYTLKKYREEQQLNFSLLSDFNKEVSTAYHTIYEEFGYRMKGVSKRSAFIIDRSGIFRYIEILENAAEVPEFTRIGKILSDLG